MTHVLEGHRLMANRSELPLRHCVELQRLQGQPLRALVLLEVLVSLPAGHRGMVLQGHSFASWKESLLIHLGEQVLVLLLAFIVVLKPSCWLYVEIGVVPSQASALLSTQGRQRASDLRKWTHGTWSQRWQSLAALVVHRWRSGRQHATSKTWCLVVAW